MADNVYGMGQIRYNSGSSYLTPVFTNAHKHKISTASLSGAKIYQDILFSNGSGGQIFSQGQAYHLHLEIPRNRSYDMVFDLKLLKTTDGTTEAIDRNVYQEIKRFVVYRDSENISNYSRVILYPWVNSKILVAIAETNWSKVEIGGVWYDESQEIYKKKITNNQKDAVEITRKNDQILNHSWEAETSEEKACFDFVFSNKTVSQNFNCILLELCRQPYDDDIVWVDSENNRSYFGLHFDLNQIKMTCNRITNLKPNNINSFTNIGVWSHPDSIMAINGEEIRIGQSGYYELNDFEITNFGIVAQGPEDRFSLDYQYKTS